MESPYEYVELFPDALRAREDILTIWSARTSQEVKLTTETPESIAQLCLYAVAVYDRSRLIAISGLFMPRTDDGEPLCLDGHLVVELAGAWTDPAYRRQGLYEPMVAMREVVADRNGWMIVCVSTNEIVTAMFKKHGAVEFPEGADRNRLCCCKTTEDHAGCGACPIDPGTTWIRPLRMVPP